jgi:UDP-glucose 4-epimerase
MRVLVTGANGFVGRAVVARCVREPGWTCRAAVRAGAPQAEGAETVRIGDLDKGTDWRHALQGVQAVVHTAARVHVMRDTARDPLAEYRRVNVAGTEALARQAAEAGVRRLVFVSSIKVLGERTAPGRPFTDGDLPAPQDPYGVSKLEAEQVLGRVAAETGLEVAIVRPVLVYGPGVSANFAALVRAVYRGIPLPLGRVHNRRSMVAVDNLADLLVRCVTHQAAAGGTFFVSDGEDLSTPALVRRLARHLGVRPRLWPVPVSVLRVAGCLTGRGAVVDRLCGSLQVDMSATCATIEWRPPVTVDAAFARLARSYSTMLSP